MLSWLRKVLSALSHHNTPIPESAETRLLSAAGHGDLQSLLRILESESCMNCEVSVNCVDTQVSFSHMAALPD